MMLVYIAQVLAVGMVLYASFLVMLLRFLKFNG